MRMRAKATPRETEFAGGMAVPPAGAGLRGSGVLVSGHLRSGLRSYSGRRGTINVVEGGA